MTRTTSCKNENSSLRILLLGDEGSGKTSLITSLLTENFSNEVPRRLREVLLPVNTTPEHQPTEIVDSSLREQSEEEVGELVRSAHVLCLVYDAALGAEPISKIRSHWIPLIRDSFFCRGESSMSHKERSHKTPPIILVANKADLVTADDIMKHLQPLLNEITYLETFLHCSAKTMQNLTDMFWYAQRAVLYPVAPLYSLQKEQLTAHCIDAFTRIFKICDEDGDGCLNDLEIATFQERCFQVPLSVESLRDIKQLVQAGCKYGVTDMGITLAGFLYLKLVFMKKKKYEIPWTILRYFGYDNKLLLTREYLRPKLKVDYNSPCELSIDATEFLSKLFDKHDWNEDECLSASQLSDLFSCCHYVPWSMEHLKATVPTASNGFVTKEGFLARWSLLMYNDPRKALELLAVIGYLYSGDHKNRLLSAMNVMRNKQLDYRKGETSRTVFKALVEADPSIDKSCFMQTLIGQFSRKLSANQSCLDSNACPYETESTNENALGDVCCVPLHPLSTPHSFRSGSAASHTLLSSTSPPIGSVPPASHQAIAPVPAPGCSRKYLILEEGGGLSDYTCDASVDVICLLYDVTRPATLTYIERILHFRPHHLKVSFQLIALYCLPSPSSCNVNSGDIPESNLLSHKKLTPPAEDKVPFSLTPTDPGYQLSQRYGLPPPELLLIASSKYAQQGDIFRLKQMEVFSKIVTLANFPPSRERRLVRSRPDGWTMTLVAGVIAGVSIAALRLFGRR